MRIFLTGATGFVGSTVLSKLQRGGHKVLGDGDNRWPAVHRCDAARLYAAVLERGVSGARYHAVAEQGVPVRDIAGALGTRLDLSVTSVAPRDAEAHFGWLAERSQMDVPASSDRTRRDLGWNPRTRQVHSGRSERGDERRIAIGQGGQSASEAIRAMSSRLRAA